LARDEQAFSVRRVSTLSRISGVLGTGPAPATEGSFAPVILAIRWACLTISALLAAFEIPERPAVAVFAALLLCLTMYRTWRPMPVDPKGLALVSPIAELVLVTLAVIATGRWTSTLFLAFIATIVVLGFRTGLRLGLAGVMVSAASILAYDNLLASRHSWSLTGQWVMQLLLVIVVTGYARRVTGEANLQHRLTLSRLGQLTDANALLHSLHRVAQTLPAALDLQDAIDTTTNRLRSLFEMDRMLILLFEETDASWEVVADEGFGVPKRMGLTSLPEPVRKAIVDHGVVTVGDLDTHGPGMHSRSKSGLYAVLPARDSIIGVVVIEHNSANRYEPRDSELLSGFVEPVALAIDNGRWFRRLRTTGAAEERTRIARDLHDRIGQSLAYVAFELDRIVKRESLGQPIAEDLHGMRGEVRTVIGEVRETLYDLRTDVSDQNDFAKTMTGFTERVSERSGLTIDLDLQSDHRLNILREREMWRIAQEALTNVERHAAATHVVITWRCDGTSATVRIEDDGRGFDASDGRLDSYGIVGMRERAAGIGAVLEMKSAPGEGTAVICRLGPIIENEMDPSRLLNELPVSTERNDKRSLLGPTSSRRGSFDQ
jgi:signal transduction histidine kinase